jgi:hypothetical protein
LCWFGWSSLELWLKRRHPAIGDRGPSHFTFSGVSL